MFDTSSFDLSKFLENEELCDCDEKCSKCGKMKKRDIPYNYPIPYYVPIYPPYYPTSIPTTYTPTIIYTTSNTK